jgi:hypothetical protein
MAGDLGDPQPIRAVVTAPDQDSRDDDSCQIVWRDLRQADFPQRALPHKARVGTLSRPHQEGNHRDGKFRRRAEAG